MVSFDSLGKAESGQAEARQAGQVEIRYCTMWLGLLWHVVAGEASFVGSWRVTVRPGLTRSGLAWQARRVETWHVEAR